MMLDTDILIDFLRGRPEAIAFVSGLPGRPLASVVSLAELYAGVRDGQERATLEGFVATLELVPLDESLATNGGLLRRQFGRSHGVGLNDALIAASALSRGVPLATLNAKHFPMLNPIIPYRKP